MLFKLQKEKKEAVKHSLIYHLIEFEKYFDVSRYCRENKNVFMQEQK